MDRFRATLYGLIDQRCKSNTKERNEQTLRREVCEIFNNITNNKINWLEPRTSTQESFEIIVIVDNSEQNNYVYSYRDNQQLPQIIELCETFKKDLQKHNLSNIGFQYHINDTNRRLSYSRNFGIDVAQGEYIITCDDDDLKINGYEIINAINNTNKDKIHEVIFCQYLQVKNKRLLDGTLTTLPKDFNDIIDNFTMKIQLGLHSSMLFHRSVYDDNKVISRFIVGIYNEDIIWFNILMEYLT
jgi:glycosyltransferase involved in cell wall biosynthesis